MPCYDPIVACQDEDGSMHILGPLMTSGKQDFRKWHKGWMLLPCGKCLGCRIEYSREWADRMMLELKYHDSDSCWFTTLTYNDFFLPVKKKEIFYNELTGETDDYSHVGWSSLIVENDSLWKRDLQLYHKRLRRTQDEKIRFFACGELGSHTRRPHYHDILFGLKLPEDDLIFYKKTYAGFDLFNSRTISKAWSKEVCSKTWPIGHAVVSKVSWRTCAYVARYVTKKMNQDIADYLNSSWAEKPFVLMSRNPGIGAQYYYDHPDCVTKEFIYLDTPDGSIKFKPPRYFYKLCEKDDPELFKKLSQDKRERALLNNENLYSVLEKDYQCYLEDLLRIKEAQLKVLDRSSF